MNKYLFWFFGLLFIVLASCKKGSETAITILNDTTGQFAHVKYTEPRLIGKWDWLSSKATNSGLVNTPLIVGYSRSIEFLNDSVFNAYRNDTLILHTSYMILKGKSIYYHTLVKEIYVNGSAFSASYQFQGEDSLIIRQECFSCATEVYTKHSSGGPPG
jgi:hypothetical protein